MLIVIVMVVVRMMGTVVVVAVWWIGYEWSKSPLKLSRLGRSSYWLSPTLGTQE